MKYTTNVVFKNGQTIFFFFLIIKPEILLSNVMIEILIKRSLERLRNHN